LRVSRPIQAAVSASALRHNYGVAKLAAPRSKVFAVVKANAYGHGLGRVAAALSGADGFATLEIEGALMLREKYPDKPVLLLEGFFDAEDLRLPPPPGSLAPSTARSSCGCSSSRSRRARSTRTSRSIPG
jgi:alanine racemase